ncbi:MAG TPA: ester cyclase [Thermoanaerobaculia bacterium]
MSQENIALAHRWFEEVWNQRRDETVDELLRADSVGHLETGDVHGVEGFKNARAQFLSALPDLRVVIEDTVAQGENVVIRWTVYGTHAGDGLGIPPCHRPVTIQGITWIKVQEGQFVEGWDRWNLGGFLANLQADETAPDAA